MGDNKSPGQLPGIALVFIALGLFVFTDKAFVPTRPDVSSEITSTTEDVRTLLWQDPFETTGAHRKAKHSGDAEEQLQRLKSGMATYSMYQNQQHQVCDLHPAATIENVEALEKSRSRLEELVYINADFNSIKEEKKKLDALVTDIVKSSAHTIDELRCQIQREYEDTLFKSNNYTPDYKKDFNVHVLAVMVHGGPYAEDKETRIRSRYAVISGLSFAGYHPYDTEHIGYVDMSSLCNRALEGYSLDKKYCDWPAIVPYEWYRYTESVHEDEAQDKHSSKEEALKAETLLVLWLDDEEISSRQPLKQLQELRDSLTPSLLEKTTRFKVMDQIVGLSDIKIKFDILGPASSGSLAEMYRNASDVCFEEELSACVNDVDSITGEKRPNDFDKNSIRIISSRATIDNAAINQNINTSEDHGDKPVQWINIFPEDSEDYAKGWFNLKRTIPTDKELVDNLLCELQRRGVNPYLKGTNLKENGGCKNFLGEGLNRKDIQDYVVLVGEFDTEYSRNFHDLFYRQMKDKSGGVKPDWLLHYNYFKGLDGSIGKSDTDLNAKDEKTSKKTTLRRPVGENQYDYLRRLGQQLSDFSSSISNKGAIRAIGIVGTDTYDKLLVLQALRSNFPDAVFFTTDLDARMLHVEENKWARNLVVASGYGLRPEEEFSKGMMPFRDGYQTALYMATLIAANVTDSNALNHQVSNMFEIGNETAIDYSGRETNNSEGNYIWHLCLLLLFLLLMYQTSNKTRLYLFLFVLAIYTISLWVHVYHPYGSAEFEEMFSGTSIWPSVITKMFAAILAVYFIFYAFAELSRNTKKLKARFSVGEMKESPGLFVRLCVSGWGCRYLKQSKSAGPGVDIREILAQYFLLGNSVWWTVRILFMLCTYIAIVFLFLSSFPEITNGPFSDRASANAQIHVVLTVIPIYLFLIFLVVDATRLNARFVSLVLKCKVSWPQFMIDKFCHDYGVGESVAEEKIKLDLIVFRSKAVDALIFLPFIVLTLIIVSGSTYFDRWYVPVPSVVVMVLGVLIAISSAIRLRRSAERVRSNVLDNLTEIYNRQLYKDSKRKIKRDVKSVENKLSRKKVLTENEMYTANMSERVLRIIEDVKDLKEGPFAPITQHPIVSAIAMPFGGVGGLFLIDYFSNVGV